VIASTRGEGVVGFTQDTSGGNMAARSTSRNARWPSAAIRRALVGLATVGLLAGCVPGSGDDEGTTLDVERALREQGDVEANVGDALEVYGVTATVLEWGRVDAYSDLEDWGYIWARVQVENTSNNEVNFHRRQFQLEKPDDSVSNTANVTGEQQLPGGTQTRANILEPGDISEGQVIFTVGDLEGQFAVIYRPEPPTDDPLDRQRGVWVFESSPDDAE
jgi:hypothetical protein